MKKVKILTITLAIIAITMIAFFGFYTQVQNRMENQIKDYTDAMDLKGSRNIRLTVSTGNTTVVKDAEGKVIEEELTDEQIAEKGYTKEEVPDNKEEIKNVENYKASKKVIEKRLKKLGVDNYHIKLDEQSGDMVIEFTENDQTDSIISSIKTAGKFEIVDSQTNEVLMNNGDIKKAKVMYGSGNSTGTANSGTSVYLDIEFNKEGKKKLEEISNQYVKVEENTTEKENDNKEESKTEEENVNEEENASDKDEKKITMKIDDETIMSTSFEEPIKIGKLQLSVGSSATDADTLQGYVDQASNMATVLDTGHMPVKYELGENQYVLSDITTNDTEIAVYVVLAIIVLGIILLFIRYKVVGTLGIISYIGFISLFMLLVRYTNVVLSLEGILGTIIVFVLDYMLINKLLKDNKIESYQEFFTKIIPIMILAITFCFIRWVPISSFGMVMFWGIVLIAIYNSIVTNYLFKIKAGKEK